MVLIKPSINQEWQKDIWRYTLALMGQTGGDCQIYEKRKGGHVGVIPTHTQRKRSNKERMTKKLANEIVVAEYPKITPE